MSKVDLMNKQFVHQRKYILYEYPTNSVQRIEQEGASSRKCPTCSQINATIFDGTSGEILCTSCGTVIVDRQETTVGNIIAKNRSGMPSSLAFPDKGLSTIINYSNTDANGTVLNQEQITTSNKIRYLDKIWGSNKNHLRNFGQNLG